jgi:hypothetical protein
MPVFLVATVVFHAVNPCPAGADALESCAFCGAVLDERNTVWEGDRGRSN